APQVLLASELGIGVVHCVQAKTLDKLFAAKMRERSKLQHCRTRTEPGAGLYAVPTEVKVHEQLIARERHPVRIAGDELRKAVVHNIDLHIRMRRAVRRPLASAIEPVVADQSACEVKLSQLQHLSFADAGPCHDEFDCSLIARRDENLIDPGLDLLRGQML